MHISNKGENLLHFVNGSVEIADYLIANGLDLDQKDEKGNTPLHIATKNVFVELVQFFVKTGADPMIRNSEGNTCYEIASESGNVEILEMLLDLIEQPDEKIEL